MFFLRYILCHFSKCDELFTRDKSTDNLTVSPDCKPPLCDPIRNNPDHPPKIDGAHGLKNESNEQRIACS